VFKRSFLTLGLFTTLAFATTACPDKQPPKEQAAEKGSQAPSGADAKAGDGKGGTAKQDGVAEENIPAGNKKGTLDSKGQVNEAAAKDGKGGKGGKGSAAEVDASAISDIYFDYDKSDLRPESRDVLKAVADLLKKNKNSTLTIEGHCDARGTEEYNQALGQRRAESARAYLVGLGIARKRVSTVSFGESQANQNATTEDQWQQDRHAKFIFK
jgi:outer membrane protein OmpA-like peptidoglycan-associated protein